MNRQVSETKSDNKKFFVEKIDDDKFFEDFDFYCIDKRVDKDSRKALKLLVGKHLDKYRRYLNRYDKALSKIEKEINDCYGCDVTKKITGVIKKCRGAIK